MLAVHFWDPSLILASNDEIGDPDGRAGKFTAISVVDEKAAMCKEALEWLLPSNAAVAICTDSQSLLKAIQCVSADTADLRCMLN